MSTRKNQEAHAVAESKLTVLVDSTPGAQAVEHALADVDLKPNIRVLEKCSVDVANAERLLVFSAASKLNRVAECVSTANKAHRLKVLFVHNDVGESWLPFFMDRFGMRALRNMLVHSDLELPTRVLSAWAIGGEDDFIATATVVNNELVVRSCALDEYSISFKAFPALQRIPDTARDSFVLEADGLLLSWPEFDVHLDLDDIRFANDPKRQQAARVASIGDARAIGAALRRFREEAGLTQSEISGVSERQVRRIEAGDRLTVDVLDAFSVALRVEPDVLLERLGEAVASSENAASDTVVPLETARAKKALSAHATGPGAFAYARNSSRKVAPRSIGEDLKLAAHSTEDRNLSRWSLALSEGGYVGGTLEHDFRHDELTFVIDEVKGPKTKSTHIALAAWSNRLVEPIVSQAFVPSVGARISVAKGHAILPRDISKLELRNIQ
jgi:transcriptional regulator with XRE-family HTH domain